MRGSGWTSREMGSVAVNVGIDKVANVFWVEEATRLHLGEDPAS